MRAVLMIALVFLTGCIAGKAGYYMVDAEKAYRLAEESGAAELAPFEFTLATEYRAKSLEEAGYSDYEPAEEYAKKVLEHSESARQIALTGAPERNMLDQMEADQNFVPDLVDRPAEEEEPAPESLPVGDDLFDFDSDEDDDLFDDLFDDIGGE